MQALVAFRTLGPLLAMFIGTAACTQGGEEPSGEQHLDSMAPPPGTIVIQPSADHTPVSKAAVATTTYQWNQEASVGLGLARSASAMKGA